MHLRTILRKILLKETQWVLNKHKPFVIAILGEKDSSYIREIIYTIVNTKYNARRNLEKTDSEFSIPLTIFGELKYPKNILSWIKIITKVLIQLLYLKPYKHYLIIQLHEIDTSILNLWLKTINPDLCITVDNSLKDSTKDIIKDKNTLQITTELIEKIKENPLRRYNEIETLSNLLDIPYEEIINTIETTKPIRTRLNIIAGKDKSLIVDARYYYYPMSLISVLEITELLPGEKYIISNENINDEIPHNYKVIKPKDLEKIKKNKNTFIFISNKSENADIIRNLALNELEV